MKNLILSACLIAIVASIPAISSPFFDKDDVITFSDYRYIVAADYSPSKVYFATTNGIWRIDRYTTDPIAPLFTGYAFDGAVPLKESKALIWNEVTATLWLWTRNDIVFYRWGTQRWDIFNKPQGIEILALGERGSSVFILARHPEQNATEPEEITYEIDPVISKVVNEYYEQPDGIRWMRESDTGINGRLRVDRRDWHMDRNGTLSNRDLRKYFLNFTLYDSHFKRRYLCYAGVGIGIVESIHGSTEIIQTGLAGKDVKAIKTMPGGFIWTGGLNGDNCGISLYDRSNQNWDYFEDITTSGLESHRIFDIEVAADNVYCASDEGLAVLNLNERKWYTRDRFDGLADLQIRRLAATQKELIVGCRQGVNIVELATGNIHPAGDRRVAKMHVDDMIVDTDTVWVGGIEGVFRWEPDEWSYVNTDSEITGSEPVSCMTLTDKYVWFGGGSGIRQYNRKTGEWSSWLHHTNMPGKIPNCMAANDSLLWIGTDSGLSIKKIEKDSWLHFDTSVGFPSNTIQALELEADTLWVGTPEGLTRFIWNRPNRDVF